MSEMESTAERMHRLYPRVLRDMVVSYNRSDLVAVALIGVLVSAWVAAAGGSFSFWTLFACELLFFSFYVTGSVVASIPGLARGVLFELPLRLLVGYAVVNTALLVLAWLSPLGIVANFAIVSALGAGTFFAIRRERQEGSAASLWVLSVCVIATTLWCQDSLDPILERGRVVVFKPWIDGFYHAVHIRIFAEGHGASTIHDFRMEGVPARLYHYGVYLLPAFVRQVSAIHSYTAFAGILTPLGVFFAGLAAYSFFGSLWGPWPGLATAAALLLTPDGSQQGIANPFMSYHWLTQISPSATYGLALLAVAWLFVLQGCTHGSRLQLVTGWVVAGILVAYKLHYVIASSLLLLLVPALFFRAEIGLRKRALWVAGAGAFYVLALWVGQQVPGVPLIRFDGSSISEILHLVGTFHSPGPLQEFLEGHLGRGFSPATNLLYGIPYVLLAALGATLPLFVILVLVLRRRVALLHLAFPLLLLLNFLLMFFGLALDMRSSTPDELLHRPIMIVYFFVAAWVGGALGLLLTKSPRVGHLARPLLLGVIALLMVVPASLGPGVQLMWAMPRISPVRLPVALVRIAEHMRAHGGPEDVFQDTQFDRFYAIAALSERKTFVAHTLTNMPYRREMLAARSAAVDRILFMRQPQLVVGTLRAFGIRWLVRQRGDRVNWPPELRDHPALEVDAYTLYDFE